MTLLHHQKQCNHRQLYNVAQRSGEQQQQEEEGEEEGEEEAKVDERQDYNDQLQANYFS